MMNKMEQLSNLGIGSFSMEDSFEDSEFADMDPERREEVFTLIFELISGILPEEYENMIIAEMFPLEDNREHTVWSILDGEKLEGKPVELMAKHEKRDIPNCTLIARVDTITNDPTELEELEDLDSDQIRTLHHLVDGLASEMGLKVSYPSISVTPIAIYR